jgi:hypothetical protein
LGLPGERGRYCAFGFVLAAGDVNGDDIDDLAVADPSYGCRDEEADFGRGGVVLLPGSADGLTVSGAQFWTQDSAGVAGASRLGNVFGESLAMGRLDGDAIDDLVVGAPGDTGGGSVTLLLGGTTGLSTRGLGGSRFTQSTPGIVGTPEPGDSFGDTVSTANVQSRTQASLIVGIPGEDVGRVIDAGAVTQLSITPAGPDPRRSRTLTADSAGVQGRAERGDQFGDSTRRWG